MKKLLRTLGSILLIALLALLSFRFFPKDTFTLTATNFDPESRLVAYTTPSLDFTFSHDLDPQFNEADFVISPAVEGKLTVNGNQLSYHLSQELTKDTTYEITLPALTSRDQSTSITPLTFNITAIDLPTVTKMLPEGEVQNLQQDITVFFSSPMVALGTLDTMKSDCPLTIEPAVEGDCKRISTSILQFRPKKLNGATTYTVTVSKSPNMLFDIADFTGSFQTPALHFEVVVEGGKLLFISNYPVETADLQNHLQLFKRHSGEGDGELSFSLESQDGEIFSISSPHLAYGDFYHLTLSTGLMSKEGNLPAVGNERLQFFRLLQRSQSFVDVFSTTGAYLATQFISELDMHAVDAAISTSTGLNIAQTGTFLVLHFQNEQSLKSEYIKVLNSKGKEIPVVLQYVKKESYDQEIGKTVEKEDKHQIKVIFSSIYNDFGVPLSKQDPLKLVIRAGIDSLLKQDYEIPLSFLSPLQQTRAPQLMSNRKICLYTNHQLYETYTRQGDQHPSPAKYFSTTPVSPTITTSSYDWDENKGETVLRCPNANQGEYLTVLHTKLNPMSNYELHISKDLMDVYGQTIMSNTSARKDGEARVSSDIVRPFTSKPLSDQDKQIFGPKQINTYPGGVPIVASFGTTNLDSFLIEACAMTAEQYKDYLTWGYDPKKCKRFTTITQKTKNLNRDLSTLQVDIEQDLFKKEINEHYIVLKAKKNKDDTGTENVYLVKDFSLFLEQGANKSLLFATDYTGTIIPGLTFTVYGITRNWQDWKQNTVKKLNIPITINGNNGVYEGNVVGENDSNNYWSYVIIARDSQGRESSIVTTDDQIYNYDIAENTYGESFKHFAYLYTDRPLYKPGDTVYFKGIMRTFGLEGFQKSPYETVTVSIRDPQREVFKELELSLDEYSNFSGSFSLPAEVALGAFSLRVHLKKGRVKGDSTFRVEEYVKPTFKFSALAKKADLLPGEQADIDIDASYYFGGAMQQAKGRWVLLSQNYFFDPKDYRDYQFGENDSYTACIWRGDCSYGDSYYTEVTFTTDTLGKHTIQHHFPKEAATEKIYTFNMNLQDPDTQKTVQQYASVILHSTDGYVGIKSPYRIDQKSGIPLEGIVLDREAHPLARKQITLELSKIEWKAVKELGPDGAYYNTYTREELLEETQTLTSDEKGHFSTHLQPQGNGDYLIKATYKGKDGQSFVSTKQIYVDGSDYVFINQGNNSITTLTAEKSLLNVGETQTFTLKSPINDATALFIVEKDDGILDYFVNTVTSFGQKFELPIKETYYPNIYVKAYLIGSQPNNPLPIYKIALGSTNVNTEYKQLNVAITTDKADYKPGEVVDITVQVTDQKGNPVANANGSLSVVDQSLLALKGNPQKNPFSFFYEMKRRLGVNSYLSLKNLVEKLEVKDDSGSKGGDGTYDSQKKRGNFRDTAYRNANFTTDTNGRAKLTTDALPDNLTTRVIEALMNTSDTKLGIQYTTIQTKQQVMINDNLPQFFGEGDRITLSPVVFNRLAQDADFTVSLTLTNGKVLTSPQTVHIAKDSSATVLFEVEIASVSETTMSTVTISASPLLQKGTQASNNGDALEKLVPIAPTRTLESTSTFGSLTTGSATEIIADTHLDSLSGQLIITQGATLLVSLLDGLHFLEQFPYDCLEQQFSALMPHLYLQQLYKAVGETYNLKALSTVPPSKVDERSWVLNVDPALTVDQAIKDLLLSLHKYQNTDGGMLYRAPSTHQYASSDLNLSVQVLNNLTLLKANNYTIDTTVITKLTNYLKAEFYRGKPASCSECAYTLTQKLEILDALLYYQYAQKTQDIELEKMYHQLSFTHSSFPTKLLQARVLAKLPAQGEAAFALLNDILTNDLTMNSKGAFLEAGTLSKRVQYTAELIKTLAENGPEHFTQQRAIIDNLQRRLINQKSNGSFGSTQDTVKVIQALAHYLTATKELQNVQMTSELFINSQGKEQHTFTDKNKLQSFTTLQPFSALQPTNQITLQKEGNGRLSYDMTMHYFLPSSGLLARDEGFFITKTYYDFSTYRTIERIKNAEQAKYQEGQLRYSQLTYPNDIFSYLQPITEFNVGQLVIVHLTFRNGKSRDNVALESYLPTSAEIINPHLDTSITFNFDTQGSSPAFEKEEYRADRFFAYVSSLPPGKWTTSYLVRMSYAGSFNVKPTRIGEFYDVAVFGRTAGEQVIVK